MYLSLFIPIGFGYFKLGIKGPPVLAIHKSENQILTNSNFLKNKKIIIYELLVWVFEKNQNQISPIMGI